MMKSPGRLQLLRMRWQKSGDWKELRATISLLRIPGERVYRLWELFRQRKPVPPVTSAGLEDVRLEAYLRLHEMDQRSVVELELFRLGLLLLTVQAIPGATVSKETIDRLLVLFWRWNVTVEPGAIRPTGEAADGLMQQMEQMQQIFASSAGIEVMAADALGLRARAAAQRPAPPQSD